MRRLVFVLLCAGLMVAIGARTASAATWTVDDDGVECPGADYTTIQAAINKASDGDTIDVYPGTYDPAINALPPGWGGTYPAQGVVVWKAGLTIRAVDPDPSNTVIQSTIVNWMDKWRIQRLTGGEWTGTGSNQTGGFNPGTSASPSAMMIVAPGVTVEGFTFHRHFEGTSATYNTAGVMIGGVAPGDPYTPALDADGATVRNCVFSDVWHAVYIWHSSDNVIEHNTVSALTTNHWAAMSVYDGYSDAQIALGHLSTGNVFCRNTLANKGIALGAWAPLTWTELDGSLVCGNVCTQVGISYAHGPVTLLCNTTPGGGPAPYWTYQADMVTRLTGVAYTGDVVTPASTSVALAATVAYDGDGDGSGVPVTFDLVGDGGTFHYAATTVAGGTASTTAVVPAGVYIVTTKVGVCECCVLQGEDVVLAVYDPTGGFVTGGGWIQSPAGAYVADPTKEGRATFGFVSKYLKGATVPSGNTEFQFRAGDLSFKSTAYEWLVIAGAKAQYKGVGTVNGVGEYGFMITAYDGELNAGADTFRIKIWDKTTGAIIYDNGVDRALDGGSIVIHKAK